MQSFMRMLSEFYKDINPANLSGAIDVVVVEDLATNELKCSPFHVRFGKGQVFSKTSERRVELIVNGKVVEGLEMRIGEAGEAFFLVNEAGEPSNLSSETVTTVPALFTSSPPITTPDGPFHHKALSEPEASPPPPLLSNSPITVPSIKTEPLSDSEVNYEKSSTKPDEVMAKSPDWDWQWGDLPVHRRSSIMSHAHSSTNVDSLIITGGGYMDIVTFLQTARNIERAYRQLQEPINWRSQVILLKIPYRIFSPRQLIRQFEGCLQECIDRIVDYEEDLMKLLDPKMMARLIVRFSYSEHESFYLAAKVALHTAISVGVLSSQPSLNVMLKLAEEPLEEALPKEQQTTPAPRSWRSWWSRSLTSPTPPVTVQPSSLSSLLPATASPSPPSTTPIAIPPLSAPPSPRPVERKHIKSLRLSSDQLKKLNLHDGVNSIVFSVGGSNGRLACSSRIVKWTSDDKVVISDIDGTITKSDALGHFFAMVGKDWTHSGVVNLYNVIGRNGYKFLYLTSRSIGQSHATQKYLRGIEQEKNQLPDGPIILSPERLFAAFKREIIIGNPEEFKIAALRDIQNLFPSKNPFYAGFGNRITDAQSYHAVGVPPSRIFTINASGAVWVEQLLFLVGSMSSTYLAMADIVDLYFPPVHTAPNEGDETFADINWWRPTRWSEEDLGLPLSASSLDKLAIVGIGEDLFLIDDKKLDNRRIIQPLGQDEKTVGDGGEELEEDEEYSDDEDSASATPFPYI